MFAVGNAVTPMSASDAAFAGMAGAVTRWAGVLIKLDTSHAASVGEDRTLGLSETAVQLSEMAVQLSRIVSDYRHETWASLYPLLQADTSADVVRAARGWLTINEQLESVVPLANKALLVARGLPQVRDQAEEVHGMLAVLEETLEAHASMNDAISARLEFLDSTTSETQAAVEAEMSELKKRASESGGVAFWGDPILDD